MALDILGILGVVDIKGHKIEIQEYNVGHSGEIVLKGSLVGEPLDLKWASTESASQPPKLSPQVIEGTSASPFGGERKPKSAENDENLDTQTMAKLVKVDETVAVARERSRGVDTAPKTLGKEESALTTSQNDERGRRLRNRQIKRDEDRVKMSNKKRLVPRSAEYKLKCSKLRRVVNYYKRHMDTSLGGNKTEQQRQRRFKDNAKDENGHKCSDCGKTFRSPSKLADHLVSHSTERPFPCNICGARFKRARHLKGHEGTHKGTRPFVCKRPNCGASFKFKNNLIGHEVVHIATRDHVCDICGKGFKRKSNLVEHVNNFHG